MDANLCQSAAAGVTAGLIIRFTRPVKNPGVPGKISQP
jgi:hypothetical protein